MKHLKKFNESLEKGQKLRDVIGDIVDTEKKGWRMIYKTDNGCTLISINEDILDSVIDNVRILSDNTGEIYLKSEGDRYGYTYYAYFENGIPKVISSVPGDERGCTIFGDVFIASGHDGNYLFNVKTGEFQDNTW